MTTRALEDSEIKAIFEHVSGYNAKRNETLLIAGIGMALRASELVGLQVSDVFDGEIVKTYVNIRAETAKYKKERTIRIGDNIQKAIADFIAWKVSKGESIDLGWSHTARRRRRLCAPPLFVSRKGGHLTRIALFQIVKKIFSKASIDQSPHCLRKTGATIYYVQSNYDLIATQLFLGHADPSTTRRYIGLTTNQIVEYAEKLSDHLFRVIRDGKVDEFNSSGKMLNFKAEGLQRIAPRDASTSELIVELQARGIDMTSAIDFIRAERKPKVAVAGSKIIALPRRDKKVDTK